MRGGEEKNSIAANVLNLLPFEIRHTPRNISRIDHKYISKHTKRFVRDKESQQDSKRISNSERNLYRIYSNVSLRIDWWIRRVILQPFPLSDPIELVSTIVSLHGYG